MSTRIGRGSLGDPKGPAALLRSRADDPPSAVPAADAVDGARDPARGGTGARVRRPRDRRGARGGGKGAAASALALEPALVGRDPPFLQLVRPARSARPQRLPHMRPSDVRPAALGLLASLLAGLALAGCGGGQPLAPEPGPGGRPPPPPPRPRAPARGAPAAARAAPRPPARRAPPAARRPRPP